MKETLQQVMQLQDLTQQIQQLENDVQMLEVDVRNSELALEDRKRRAAQAHTQRMEGTRKADALQLNIEGAEQEKARQRVKMNAVKTQKEMDAIRHTILKHSADIEKWEDEALVILQRVDEVSREENRMALQVHDAGEELQKVRAQVAEQTAGLRGRIAALQQQADALRRQIDPGVLGAYERLTTARRNNGLAEVHSRVCQGCYTSITKQTENLLMRDNEIVYCHSCGRMLILKD